MKFKHSQLVQIKPSAPANIRLKYKLNTAYKLESHIPDSDGDVVVVNHHRNSSYYIHIDHLLSYHTKPQTRRTTK